MLEIGIPVLGIIGLCTGNRVFFVIALVLIIIDNIIGFTSGELKSIKTQVFAAVIGGVVAVIFDYDIFNTVVFALCVENILLLVGGVVLMLFYGRSSRQ